MSVTIDFSDPVVQADPYPIYAGLRRDHPINWDGRTWVISRELLVATELATELATESSRPRSSTGRIAGWRTGCGCSTP